MKSPVRASERPNSFDENGSKIRIIPAEVRGYFRQKRDLVQIGLIIFFLLLPWTKINGLQSLFIDLQNRRLVFFGVQFMPHDAPLVFLVAAILALSLALMTALWGRAWCGWACPQTVFIDGVFRRIEIWVEGNYIERRRLEKAPWSLEKIFKLVLKWVLFLLVASVIAHSFIAYFAGAENLISMMQNRPQDNWSYFILVSVVTAILLFNFAWFREQFCLVMCPYGRFQSVLLDKDSKTVLYDEKRNDCVACNRCVQVCPTGIDIRHGVQMECIACTACIDACDEIMKKVHQPVGLIRYASESRITKYLRPRTVTYGVVLFALISVLGFQYSYRQRFLVSVLRGQDLPYQSVQNEMGEKIINHVKLHLHNQMSQPQNFHISISDNDSKKGIRLVMPNPNLQLAGWTNAESHIFLEAPIESFRHSPHLEVEIAIQSSEAEEILLKKINLVGPLSAKEDL